MKIGHIQIGVCANKKAWINYMRPKYMCGGKHKHSYFQYFIRWFNIYWCKPRKCDDCGEYITEDGIKVWDSEGNKVLKIVFKKCYNTEQLKKKSEFFLRNAKEIEERINKDGFDSIFKKAISDELIALTNTKK